MESQKLTQEELTTINELQENNRAVVFEFGDIQVIEYALQKRKKLAEEYLDNLRKREEEFTRTLTEKYGDGTIDLKTGEFVPSEQK